MESVNERQQRWLNAIVVGIVNIIIGVLLIIFKKDSLDIILIVSGVMMVIDGIIILINSLKSKLIIPLVVAAVLIGLGIALKLSPN